MRDRLEKLEDVEGLKILACGGDGTGKWILVRSAPTPSVVCAITHLTGEVIVQETMDEMQLEPNPPVAVLPLGTGNDIGTCIIITSML